MSNRIRSWDNKLISRGGKEVLLKTVVQSVPTYAMNVFLLPTGMCTELERMMARFWWKSGDSQGKGIIWRSWDRMTRHKKEGGMGFRSLRRFNMAMIGKQGWRMITRPDSLVSRVYKARYYPQGDFLSAALGSNPSYIWRSIREAQGLLKVGLRRRVGSGESVSILNDPWLPREENPYVNQEQGGMEGKMVNNLFCMEAKEWDEDLVRDMFNEQEAAIILGIQLSESTTLDSWYWIKEITGVYSVRSAYRWLMSTNRDNQTNDHSKLWAKFWRLKVPPKTKDTVWRAGTSCLPTKLNLQRKKVPVNFICPLCNIYNETIWHCMVTCEFSWSFWEVSGLQVPGREGTSFCQWLEEALDRLDEKKAARVVMVCWSIWRARNEVVWNHRWRSAEEVVSFAMLTLNNYLTAQDVGSIPSLNPLQEGDGAEQWAKPVRNTIKINVDAAIFEAEKHFGFACVIRDDEGLLMETVVKYVPGVVTPALAEAIGIKEALSWVKRHQCNGVEIESDSLVSIQAIRDSTIMHSIFGLVVQECKQMYDSLSNVCLHFVKRPANRVAHALARQARLYAGRSFREGNAPTDISEVLMDDLID